jgi:hypothetical protein
MALTAVGTSLPPEPAWGRCVFLTGDVDGVRGSKSGRGEESPPGADSNAALGLACLRVSAAAAAVLRPSAEPTDGVSLALLFREGDWNAVSVPVRNKKHAERSVAC